MGRRHTIGLFGAVLLCAAITPAIDPGSVSAAPAAAAPERGEWRVAGLGAGRFLVTWTSPVRLPVTSDRPTVVGTPDQSVGVPTIGADGRTVRVLVTAPLRPEPRDLDVLLSGDRLDVAGRDARAAVSSAAAPATRPRTRALSVDPGTPGAFEVVTSDYQLDPVKLVGMPAPIEMVGHVVEPAADAVTGPRPLVVFLHGRHDFCYDPVAAELGYEWPCVAPMQDIPSHLGYDYIQRLLASQGYATVSVRVNGVNAQDSALPDGGADARAAIVRRHLDHWVGLAAAHQVDLDRVVLVGHSRGGEGVDRASIQIPLSAPYRIVGQVLIAPTDFGAQTAPYVPTVTLLPYCDGDVSDLQGQKYTDTARDLASDDTSLKSSVLVMGANHNYFNSEWTPATAAAPSFDDWSGAKDDACGRKTPDRLKAVEQRAVARAYVAGAVRLFAGDEQDLLPLYDGSRATVASIGEADVRSHAIGGGRDVRRPGIDTGLSLAVGAQTQFCAGVMTFENRFGMCGRNIGFGLVTPHWPSSYEQIPTRRFFEMAWDASGQTGGMVLDVPLDLTARRLDLRTIVDPRLGNVSLRVRVSDADGGSAVLTPSGGALLPALLRASDLTKLWAQTLVVDPSGAAGVDLSRIVRIDLIGDSVEGRVWVADLASAPATSAPVPARRAPLLSLSRLRLEEGDEPGSLTARLPFRVEGDTSRPSRFVVVTAGQERGQLQRFTVDLAAGQTSGSIPIGYDADRRDDFNRSITQVSAWATRGLMTDDYLGQLTVLDDDPTPPITLTPVSRTVQEGEPAAWRVRLGARVDYDVFVQGKVVRGPEPELRGSDVPVNWLVTHVGEVDETLTLRKLGVYLYDNLRSGSRTLIVSIPTRRDGAAEARESVTVRFRIDRTTYTRTVHVAPSS